MTAPACPYDPRAGLYVGGPAFGLSGPVAPPPPLGAEGLELLIRFEHPAKLLAVGELPGAALLAVEHEACAYGTTAGELARVRADVRARVAEAAGRLLADEALRRAVHRLPAGVVVALGDSITDDLLSWAEILRACAAIERPGELTLVNAGVSGDTTTDALRRLYGVVELRPALVVAMLGTNDCQRHGPDEERLVSLAETERHLAAISAWLRRRGAALTWLTPPPVLEPALAAAVGERPFTMRDADVRELGERLALLGDPVVDTAAALRAGPLDELLLPDGVHPSLEGQTAIARAILLHASC